MFQAERIGDIFYADPDYINKEIGPNLEGMGKMISHMADFGARGEFTRATHHPAAGADFDSGMFSVCETTFFDKLVLVSAIEERKPAAPVALSERMFHSEMERAARPIFSLLEVIDRCSESREKARLLGAMEGAHNVKLFSMEEARSILAASLPPAVHDMDWLLSLVPRRAN
jgi:hypothetical protein